MALQLKHRVGDETRKHTRLVKRCPVNIRIIDSSDATNKGVVLACTAHNVSAYGMELETPQRLAGKTEVEIELRIPTKDGPRELALKGIVIWSRRNTATNCEVAGIRLHEQPADSMRLWIASVFEEIRFRNVVD